MADAFPPFVRPTVLNVSVTPHCGIASRWRFEGVGRTSEVDAEAVHMIVVATWLGWHDDEGLRRGFIVVMQELAARAEIVPVPDTRSPFLGLVSGTSRGGAGILLREVVASASECCHGCV